MNESSHDHMILIYLKYVIIYTQHTKFTLNGHISLIICPYQFIHLSISIYPSFYVYLSIYLDICPCLNMIIMHLNK